VNNFMFAGPTLAGLADPAAVERAGFVVLPPIRRGDLLPFLDQPPGIVAIVDGAFDQSLAVGHAELRTAIVAGWRVWGLSSMGAIRAFEMRDFGMRGFGKIFSHFLAGGDFQDDEVAQLHLTEPSYGSVTEPLIHLRYVVRDLEESGALDAEAARQVVLALKGSWYGDRTLSLLTKLVETHSGRTAGDCVRDMRRFRIKIHDLESFLAGSPWQSPQVPTTPAAAPYWPP
jgi:hypothetical protein